MISRQNDFSQFNPFLFPLEEIAGKRIFITGGTGFFGKWLLEGISALNRKFRSESLPEIQATILSRNPDRLRDEYPHLTQERATTFLAGDIANFPFPVGARFDWVIHAATPTDARIYAADALSVVDTLVQGTRHVLDFARAAGAERFLLTSSGAVYGKQPPEISHVTEEYLGAPDPLNPANTYGEGKRMSEQLCALYSHYHGLHVTIARCFAFAGPYLPIDQHFAIGNFVRDALRGGPIQIGGDGTPFRSYLYGSDLVGALFLLLARGENRRAYNVGSSEAISIADLARKVAAVTGAMTGKAPAVEIAKAPRPGQPRESYVPSTSRIETELGFRPQVSLEQAIRSSLEWNRL